MSPRTADPAVREALVEAAARLIAQHETLTTRRLAAEVGTSTMAVYTHFGSLDEVRRAVRGAGFQRLRENMALVTATDDPVADLGVAGWGYCVTGIKNPNLYRVMFMETPLDDLDATVGLDTFEMLVANVQRCIDAGRFQGDAWELATQMWTMVHGAVALHIAGMFDEATVIEVTVSAARAFFVNYGDSPAATESALERMIERVRGSAWWPDNVPPEGLRLL